MEEKKLYVTDQFFARDSEGTRYPVIEYTEVTYARTNHTKSLALPPPVVFYRLVDGSRVEPVGDGAYDARVEVGTPKAVRLTRM